MKIKKVEFQNFKSYGMAKQTIEFDDQGGLILLSGNNGSGKSTIRDVIDLCLFNKVPGKRKKYTPNSSLPNRHNRSLYAGLEFETHNNDNMIIMRYIEPTKNKIFINNLDETDYYRKLTTEQKEHIIGYSYDTFKSFISMSMTDFKNFIVLKNTEKVNLVNKLFNLEKLDQLSTVTKDYIKEIDKAIELNQNKLSNNTELLTNTEKIIQTFESRESVV
jgi:DNA repair exonuclease SbcCD ATPase subunit